MSSGLKKSLGFKTIIFLTVNSIMGTGIFFLPAVGAGVMGTSSIIAWVVLSLVSIYIATLFAELCSMFPKAGGIYEFAKHVYPRPVAFLVGWSTLVASNITIAMLIIGAIQYLLPFDVLYVKELVAISFIILFNYISFKGIKTSSIMLVTFACITLGTLGLIIIANFVNFNLSNLAPTPWDISLLLVTIYMIAETFFGWESPLFLAEETKNGHIVVPRALVIGTVFITLISLLLVVSSLGSLDHQVFAGAEAPLLALAENNFGEQAIPIFTILIYVSLIGSVAAWITTSPRLVLSLAKDKLFPGKFAAIHSKNATPHNAIIFQTIVSIFVVLLGSANYNSLLEMLLPLLLFLYASLLLTVSVLRIRRPDLKRYFHAPFGTMGPFVVVVFLGVLFYQWFVHSPGALHSLQLALTFIFFGVPVYFFMQLQYNPAAVNALNNGLSYLNLLLERFIVPSSLKQEVLRLLGDIRGKTVLEFGSSVGSLTRPLAEEVGPSGAVYTTDVSAKNVSITKARLARDGYSHVVAYHDPHQTERIYPDIPLVDMVVSVGSLDSVLQLDRVLSGMNARLDFAAPICFVEYDRFFHVISNVNWLGNDTMIKHIFRRNGFLVNIIRRNGLLWETVYIHGKKVMDRATFDERVDMEEVYDDRSYHKGLYDLIKKEVTEFRERIHEGNRGFLFLYASSLDAYDFWVNTKYFSRLYSILLDVMFHYSPEEGTVVLQVDEADDSLVVHLLAQVESHVIVNFSHDYGSLDRHRELSYCKRLVQLGYKGEMEIARNESEYVPAVSSGCRQFSIGEYEEMVIGADAPFIKITITIPLDRLRS
ncbi:MAG: amino acid permease [Nanobdellota archaeon]